MLTMAANKCGILLMSSNILDALLVRLLSQLRIRPMVRPHSSTIHQFGASKLDSFISSVQSGYGVRKKINRNANAISSSDDVMHKKHIDPSVMIEPIKSSEVRTPVERERRKTRLSKEDKVVDEKVHAALKTGLDGALLTLRHYAVVNRYPSKKTLQILARCCAEAGNYQSVLVIHEICKESFPEEFDWQMQYMHYYAEGLWKSGKHKESIAVFEKLLIENTQQRKKISDMVTFLVRNLLQSDLEEELLLLVESVKSCAKAGTNQAAANVWFNLFISQSERKHLLAMDIVKSCENIKPFIINKVDSVLKTVQDLGNDVLYRLIEILLYLNATTEYSKVYGALLERHCNEGNVASAAATFQCMRQEKLTMDFEKFLKFKLLLMKSMPSLDRNHTSRPKHRSRPDFPEYVF